MIGQTISHYKILNKLGEGGMGVVYKAMDITLGRIVALKFVSAEMATNESTKHRLMREAKACASLNHPNINTIFEFVEAEDRSFIVMEYIEGKTLQELVNQKHFEVEEVLEIALQVVDALDVAHKQGIVHRDLKSANIMLDVHDRVKIMDFGLAKLSRGSLLTQTGATLGTAAYMSPEQAQGEEVDLRSDIYSIGVVLYELLTGELPFKEAHQLAVMYSIVHEAPNPPRELNPAIPAELEAVVLKAMEKDPNDRYQNFADMKTDLMELQETLYQPGTTKKSSQRVQTDLSTQNFQTLFAKTIYHIKSKSILKFGIPLILITAGFTAWLLQGDHALNIDDSSNRIMAKSHEARTWSYLNENKPDLAMKELELAVNIDPTYSTAWSTLAALNIQAQKLDMAISQSKKAIDLDESNSTAYYNLAYALEEKGELDPAGSRYAEAVRIDSTFTRAYSALGNVYIKLNKPHEAINVLNTAVRLTPESEFIYLIYKNLGKAYFMLNQYDEALKFLTRSLQLQPGEIPETIYYLAMTYEAAGMRTESIANWQHYLEIENDALKRKEALTHLQNLTK
ncbi:MAG: protein kinase [bacterium]